MKKLIALFLPILILAEILCACSDGKKMEKCLDCGVEYPAEYGISGFDGDTVCPHCAQIQIKEKLQEQINSNDDIEHENNVMGNNSKISPTMEAKRAAFEAAYNAAKAGEKLSQGEVNKVYDQTLKQAYSQQSNAEKGESEERRVENSGSSGEWDTAAQKAYDEYDYVCNDPNHKDYECGIEYLMENYYRDLTIDDRSIRDVVDMVYEKYGMSPSLAFCIYDEYNYDATHGGFTWAEYQNAIEAIYYTASIFPQDY